MAGALTQMRSNSTIFTEMLFSTTMLEALMLCQDGFESGKDPAITLGAEIIRRMAYVAGSDKVEKMISEYRTMLQAQQDSYAVKQQRDDVRKAADRAVKQAQLKAESKEDYPDTEQTINRKDWTPEEKEIFLAAREQPSKDEQL